MPDAELRTEQDLAKALKRLDKLLDAPGEDALLEEVVRRIMRYETRRAADPAVAGTELRAARRKRW